MDKSRRYGVPVCEPIGEYQIGPLQYIKFRAVPLPFAKRSCILRFDGCDIVVDVDSIDDKGYAHGRILETRRGYPHTPPVTSPARGIDHYLNELVHGIVKNAEKAQAQKRGSPKNKGVVNGST